MDPSADQPPKDARALQQDLRRDLEPTLSASVETVDQERPRTVAPEQVGAMFDRIAGVYDPLNSIMSMGLHRQWTRRAADLARVSPGERVLDVATGTGDLAIELATRVSPGGEVVGCDFSAQMLARAHTKAPRIRFELADALAPNKQQGGCRLGR